MKTSISHTLIRNSLAVLLGGLLFSTSAEAQISGINAPASAANIKFNDTNSIVPPAGTTIATVNASPWNGLTLSLGAPVDPVTLDFATGDLTATGAGVSYSVLPNNIQLDQVLATSGFALLIYTFTVDYALVSALPLQATLYPNFLVSGTVGASERA